jgi:hypothetical protein
MIFAALRENLSVRRAAAKKSPAERGDFYYFVLVTIED